MSQALYYPRPLPVAEQEFQVAAAALGVLREWAGEATALQPTEAEPSRRVKFGTWESLKCHIPALRSLGAG